MRDTIKQNRRVLIVDDSQAIHEDFRKTLGRQTSRDDDRVEAAFLRGDDAANLAMPALMFDLSFAEQGMEAVDLAMTAEVAGAPFAVAFVDMRMPPGWDGMRTIEELWSVSPNTEVVICTAYSDRTWEDVYERFGGTDKLLIIKKPFDPLEVRQLAVALTEKWHLARLAEINESRLSELVESQTTQLAAAERNASRQRDLWELSATMASIGHWRIDVQRGDASWSSQLSMIFGVEHDLVIPSRAEFLSHVAETDRELFEGKLQEAVENRRDVSFDVAIQRHDGRVRFLRTKATCEVNEQGEVVALFGVSQDVTEHQLALQAVEHAAYHDGLTGLANRARFMARLNDELKRARRNSGLLGLVILDLDHFKQVNDTLGHPVGDDLLVWVAGHLEACSRETDCVARLGGDEFAILATDIRGGEDVARLARRIEAAMSEHCVIQEHSLQISQSMGIAIGPQDGAVADELLKNADLALYKAKSDGRGVFRYFEAEMDQRVQQRRKLESELRDAIDKQQFTLHYQPAFLSNSKKLSVLEALVRWQHPVRGLVYPGEFIPVAESNGLLIDIGDWVLEQACRDAMQWPSEINLAVNVSATQFRRGVLLSSVRRVLNDTGLPAHRLEVELTESALIGESVEVEQTLASLRELGVKIVLDDFGVGYSSLGYLRRFRFDKLKIDRSFVSDAGDCEEAKAIVCAVAGLGKNLGIETTAEGVEREHQLEHVVGEGYTEVQGFLHGRPRPIEEIREAYFSEFVAEVP